MSNLVFLHLWLWVGACIIWWSILFLYYTTKKHATHFKFIADIEAVFWKSQKYFSFNITLLFLMILILSIILADPNLKVSHKITTKNGIDIAIVLDLSYSMVATDIEPNRLEVAKQVISDFTSQLKTDRVGLILFSWKPFTSVPLTFDYNFITEYVKNLSIQSINQNYNHLQWTAIWDGLLYGAQLFDDESKREKVIVLLTDGEANRWIDPLKAIEYIQSKGIKVHTVWIWWDKDTYVNFTTRYGSQKIAVWWIDENNLKAIANLTQWMYYRANNNETFKQLFAKLDLLDKNEIQVDEYQTYQPFYKLFVYILFWVMIIFIVFNTYYYLRNTNLWEQ